MRRRAAGRGARRAEAHDALRGIALDVAVIHPTAQVDPRAELAADVEVGAYAVVGPHVSAGAGTRIGRFRCRATVDDQVVCEAVLMAAVRDVPPAPPIPGL